MKLFVNSLSFLLNVSVVALVVGGATGLAIIREHKERLPSIEPLLDYRPSVRNLVEDSEGSPLLSLGKERRDLVSLDEIPEHLINAFIAAEDKNFWDHEGYDALAITRAAVRNFGAGGVKSGASTITQQLVKNVVLTTERSIERKIQEALLAFEIEKHLSKDEILERYLNEIYLGRGAYGVSRAAEIYFGKSLSDLTLSENAFLAGLPKAPTRYGLDIEQGKGRQSYVLSRMSLENMISEEEYAHALAAPLLISEGSNDTEQDQASHFVRSALTEVESIVEDAGDALAEGYVVRITQDSDLQGALEKSLREALIAYEYRQSAWKGPYKEDLPPVDSWTATTVLMDGDSYFVSINGEPLPLSKDSVKFANRGEFTLAPGMRVLVEKVGDKAKIRQVPDVQGAAVAMDPKTGRVLAMTGSFTQDGQFFNRAMDAHRQPGSLLKPFIYAQALEDGWSPTSPILDAGVAIQSNGQNEVWRPRDHNFSKSGFVTLRSGLEYSRNSVTLRLAEAIGEEKIGNLFERMGIHKKAEPGLSIALGSQESTLLDLVSAYAALASDGAPKRPVMVESVSSKDGTVVYEPEDFIDEREPFFDEVTLAQIRSMMAGVTEYGTAWRAFDGAGYTVHGKTGTTNQARDTWFIGFTENLVVGAFVGFDTPEPLGRGESGGSTAAPIVRAFFDQIDETYRISDYQLPAGAKIIEIDPDTGIPFDGGFKEIIRDY